MSHPDGLPDLFVDRSLGRIKVPELLRAEQLRLVTLAEHYGIPADESVADVDWLKLAGTRNWTILMKDEAIRRNQLERRAVKAFQVRCFCLTRQDLSAQEMARRFVDNLPAMVRACSQPGPFIYAVHANRIERLPL